ncbi:LptF/LptG family permease [Aureibacter tunicatorum]|uniref:Lipopolysaccharide export system permease protein n=1 Tax=Aureibacter tunicatorum TaxID=866807 RepID=A0AAE3XHS1_9BACT|nr:LptF/LptG family permease [Aureibacter tunicatorum]MDR6237093.1 lipopolysaccharide export system permease protein [Aureibacter tunicatorum]BDD06085.1 membrane protein [Aureibacter tunicatorum]
MFKVLDRYILKRLLTTYVFVVMIIVAVVVVIDMTEKNHKFIQHNLGFAEIAGYYMDFAPYIANFITPLMVFITTVYVTSQMASHTEIIAILSSGISFKRLMVPYLIAGGIIASASFYLNGWVIPNTNKDRLAFETTYFKRKYHFDESDVHIKVSPDTYLYLKSYNVNSDQAYKVTLEKIDGNQLISKLSARRMKWNEDIKKWQFIDWEIRDINGTQEIFTHGDKLDSALNLTPKYFSNNYKLYEALTLNEIDKKIADLESRGADNVKVYRIEKYIRYMSPFAVVILTLIGLVVSSRKARGGTGYQIALGFVLAFIYIIFFMFSRSLAEAGSTNPILAVWIPNIIFAIIGVFLYTRVPK